ncbi:hypothetical protein TNCV_949411 [Trichonephila clavipes]|nr:hypothetical protein TNCV_949411 [Trichonephila clavipes]
MTFWKYTPIGLTCLLTRPAYSVVMPEWRATICSNALNSMDSLLTTSPVGTLNIGVKWSRSKPQVAQQFFSRSAQKKLEDLMSSDKAIKAAEAVLYRFGVI